MKRYLWLLISSILMLFNNKSYADCWLKSGVRSATLAFNLNNFKLSFNTDNTKSIYVTTFSAAQIANEMGIGITDPIFSCDEDEDNVSLMFGDSVLPGRASIKTPHGTGGLEIIPNRLYLYFTISGGKIGEIGYPQTDGSNYSHHLGTRRNITWEDIGSINIYLYKTGAIDIQKTLSNGMMFKLVTSGKRRSTSLISIRHSGLYRFKATGCMTIASTPTVNFGNVPSYLFKGIGTTAGHADFNISIECTEKIKPTITFSAKTINGAPESIIQLDRANATNTAKGVGVQILYMGTPIPIGKPFIVGYSDRNSDYNLPFTARYYQTNDRIKGGTANATAHFTVQYE
ncbi:fimbrial protein [Photorhabdus antumapuensis]|uniref:fimbrial protein n=1 Tax=Photorhabdus antumapuensis TaxID=2862867 RepID=UPI001CEC4D98|nr:fimbrial protein [Photorhabdus antumapuensis]MCA6221612.1 fimbrial protein [Photorhabdus antumapuensis]